MGRILVAAGVLLLLFTAYQLWGTGLFESHSQDQLRSRFDRELPAAAARASEDDPRTTTVAAPPSSAPRPAPASAAPADGQPVGVIQIPAIGVDQVVVQGTSTDDLRSGPGHYAGTPLPGQAGNAAIAGHRTTYGHPFYNLNEVVRGDPVVVTTRQGVFTYRVDDVSIVSPSDSSVLAPTTAAELTLTTCNPRYSASQRLVVKAGLVGVRLFTSTTKGAPRAPARRTSRRTPGSATGLAGSTGGWVAPVLWGLLLAAVTAGVWVLTRRRRHPWLASLLAVPVLLVILFFFFASLSPLLPASF